jgi:FKBP-type peptidyl-prolyl cis-trans isomerase
MKKQSLLGLLAIAVLLVVNACKKGQEDFKTTEDGLKYKYIVNSDTGEVAGEGGYLELHIVVETHLDSANKDTTLSSSYTSGYGINKMLVGKPTYKGCINGGFAMLKAGDSVVFKVLADSLYQKTFRQPVPPFLTGKEEIVITTKVMVSENKESFDQRQKEEQEKNAKAQQELLEKEQKELKAAAEKMGYADKLELSPSGLYYVKLKETNGKTAKTGDIGSFFYKGMYLDGSVFDENYGKEPFPVSIGRGGAIAGWMEVVDKIKVGEKWMLFIPSSLAYGERGSGKIGPNTPLIFEMELSEVKTAEQAQKEQEARMKKLAKEEETSIKKYIQGKNFKKDSERDIYYSIANEGVGNTPDYGDNLRVVLKSYDLKGNPIKEFSMENPPIEGPLNRNTFPAAMETAILKLKKGGLIKVVTPSRHFQGEQGGGPVPPHTPVYFELELKDVTKAKK